jgi:hypothetical protein
VNIRAVDAAERLVAVPDGGALDGAFSAWVVWSVTVEVKDLGVGKGRDVEAQGLLGLPGEHQEGRQRHEPDVTLPGTRVPSANAGRCCQAGTELSRSTPASASHAEGLPMARVH